MPSPGSRMTIAVGVDAGGTGSRAVVVRAGTVVERRDLGPLNVLLHAGAVGRDAAGRNARAGGHGYLLGDEGSGYWIGREAVRAALRAADGTGPPTVLAALVQEAFESLVGAEQQVHQRP